MMKKKWEVEPNNFEKNLKNQKIYSMHICFS